jgi:hypothetical protein
MAYSKEGMARVKIYTIFLSRRQIKEADFLQDKFTVKHPLAKKIII